jgi:hypothetical protein
MVWSPVAEAGFWPVLGHFGDILVTNSSPVDGPARTQADANASVSRPRLTPVPACSALLVPDQLQDEYYSGTGNVLQKNRAAADDLRRLNPGYSGDLLGPGRHLENHE